LFAFSLQLMRERGEPVRQFIEAVTQTFFGIARLVMRAAPIGALAQWNLRSGATAWTP
jgi:Na+/H+-dicarboxylate symporter